jgi:hypothetical protein
VAAAGKPPSATEGEGRARAGVEVSDSSASEGSASGADPMFGASVTVALGGPADPYTTATNRLGVVSATPAVGVGSSTGVPSTLAAWVTIVAKTATVATPAAPAAAASPGLDRIFCHSWENSSVPGVHFSRGTNAAAYPWRTAHRAACVRSATPILWYKRQRSVRTVPSVLPSKAAISLFERPWDRYVSSVISAGDRGGDGYASRRRI